MTAACAGAPRPVAAAPTAPAPDRRVFVPITGFVVNGVTSRPIAGATVRLEAVGQTTSDTDGRFQFPRVPTGVLLLHVSAPEFRDKLENERVVHIVAPETSDPIPQTPWGILMFKPSPYFDAFPPAGATKPCKTESDCGKGLLCLRSNFKEVDMPACTQPVPCATERDCKTGQQCETVDLLSGEQARICQGQPAPEAEPEPEAAPGG